MFEGLYQDQNSHCICCCV